MSTTNFLGYPPADQRAWQPRVLHIDDDEKYCRLVASYLGRHGYTVTSVPDGTQGLKRILAERWDLVLLDVMLPDIDGFELLREVRAASQVPVLMLSARGEELDRVCGLDLGADDYLPKLLSVHELLARVAAVLRRLRADCRRQGTGAVRFGSFEFHPDACRAFLGRTELLLTQAEFAILFALARSKGQPKSRAELLEESSETTDASGRMIDVQVFSLRKKLAAHAGAKCSIRTVRNVGYMLVDPA